MSSRYQQQTKSNQGFTIIEVVLVLAIAGLILLMVLLAFPALQRGQKDAQRKNDLARISTQVTSFSGSTRGNVPTSSSIGTFVSKYLGGGSSSSIAGDEYIDPNGNPYTVSYNNSVAITSPAANTVYYSNGQLCSDNSPGDVVSPPTPNPRNYTLRIKLENQSALYCLDNR